tara:strand:- start:16238 stop:18178 length:1941 start_codon:yes stop_codon:yes gene_type:complete
MGFQVSPGVNVREIDLTTIIPAVATTSGGIAGAFQWGPANQRILVDSEANLRDLFGDPNDDTFEYFMTAANFLAYGNNLQVVRVVGSSAKNAGNSAGILVENDEKYDSLNGSFVGNDWVAKYAGVLGNSIKVSHCDSATAFSSTLTGGVSGAAAVGDTVVGLTVGATANLSVNDKIVFVDSSTGEQDAVTVTAISDLGSSGATVTITPALTKALSTGASATRKWRFFDVVDSAPGTSQFSIDRDNSTSNDEIHVIVYDADGKWSGVEGTVLEKFDFMSVALGAKTDQGGINYFKEKINRNSKYIYWAGNIGATNTNWGEALTGGMVFGTNDTPSYEVLTGGVDDNGSTAINNDINDVDKGYDLFKDAETVDVSLLLGGPGNATNGQFLIDEICDKRKDCVAFLSPEKADVVDVLNTTTQKDNVIDFRDNQLNRSSSYAVLDSGYKYQFDRYNDVFRYVPLNGDIAGLCVRNDEVADPWFSPAGFNRGQIKRVTRLAFNPRKAHRDELYKAGVNPVVSFPGEGVVLFGDKTLQSKPSAFDRINVRRLFIVLEKAIATAAKFSLFELNDSFTRAQFKNLVEPFLRDVQGRRGITDFKVVCDESNNTGEVIDRNEFVADIFIKPARSINFIQLNFIATRTGVDFSELTS